MVLRRIFGPKRDWRKLHNEELHNLIFASNIIELIKSRRIRWARHVASMGEERNAYTVLVGKLEGKRQLGRPRCKWLYNIRMDQRSMMGWYRLD
jgi:hypothetical protein